MKVPLNWLADYVDLSLPVPELARRLTLAGLEVASVRLFGLPVPDGLRLKIDEPGPAWERDKVLTALVTGVDKHPNADTLKLVHLDMGPAGRRTVVTGAPNLHVGGSGQKVVVGLAGAAYWDGHATPKKLATLKPKDLRGVMNDAMVMSNFELGVNDEHEGIILLEEDAPVGVPAVDLLGDVVLEIELTPNLARCQSIVGVAREAAALCGGKVRQPSRSFTEAGERAGDLVRVRIDDPKDSARYTARVIRDVQSRPSPQWMQRRLGSAGMRAKGDVVVDVTNYVMLELGQPLHAFDYDALVRRAEGGTPTITVRLARPGERLKTLDGQDRELSPEHLVIADGRGPVALAGVMGGAETEVSRDTRNVLLESASFDFVRVRKASRALNLNSEASARFSRGVHPEQVAVASERAAALIAQHAGGRVCAGVVDAYPAPLPTRTVTLTSAQVRRTLGVNVPLGECERVLRSLEFAVERADNGLRATVPTHRLDIQEGPADLIEEVARVRGYDTLPATLLAAALPEQRSDPRRAAEERVRDVLVNIGLTEAITYSLADPEREGPFGAAGEPVALLNPISVERRAMRRTLLPGLLDALALNLKYTKSVRMFELGTVYLPRPGQQLPDEPLRLGVVLSGPRRERAWNDPADDRPESQDFTDLKGVVEELCASLSLAGVTVRPSAAEFLHPGKAAELLVGGHGVGSFGELHPRVAKGYNLGGRAVLAAELELGVMLDRAPARGKYQPVPLYEAALRDVAVIVPEATPADAVADEIRAAGGALLRGAELFDVYRGPSIPEGTKSLAYALTYQAPDRTLGEKEIETAHKKVEGRLRHVLKAQIRGKD